jgi:hypothetical protein
MTKEAINPQVSLHWYQNIGLDIPGALAKGDSPGFADIE